MTHPYRQFPDHNFWSRSVSDTPWPSVFQSERGKFTIAPQDRIATAGSCFAQRIASHLRSKGFQHTIFELAHPLVSAERAAALGYDVFSARYGNIYTTRQLRQLIDEALGLRDPIFDFAQSKNGLWVDLIRPGVHGDGFQAEEEARADRRYHLGVVRDMFAQSQVFVFTLGLTEAWLSADGGVVYGTHPNVATGRNVRSDCVAVNLDYLEVFNDLVYVINLLRQHNGGLKFIFTVSPVALAATHQNKHVLTATSYSKSVLRAVAGRIADSAPFADYFMSYELFNSAQSFGQFLSSDLRDVSARGVGVAMQLFESMYVDSQQAENRTAVETASTQVQETPTPTKKFADVECEEILNDSFGQRFSA